MPSTVDKTTPTTTPSTAAPAIRVGGKVTVAVDQMPASFNPRTILGNLTATRDIVRSVLPSAWDINERFEFERNRRSPASAWR